MNWRKVGNLTRVLLNSQRGLTGIELIVGVALLGIVGVGGSMVFSQIMIVTAESQNHMQAMRNVQNAGYWISMDGQQSAGLNVSDDASTPDTTEVLTLNWDYTFSDIGQVKHKIVYTLDEGVLTRIDTINDSATTSMRIAEDITSVVWDADNNRVVVSSTVGGLRPSSAVSAYRIKLRTQQ